MGNYVGHRLGAIVLLAEEHGKDRIPVPLELAEIPPRELLSDYQVRGGKIVKQGDFKDTSKLKAAFISVYGIACGISTYSEQLWPELGKMFGDYMIFSEKLMQGTDDSPKIKRCWQRGKSVVELLSEVREYDPDVVYIQHEYGIFPSAANWLALLSGLGRYRVIVCLHSVYDHEDKAVSEFAVKEAIVHTEAGAEALKKKSISTKITVIPHGCVQSRRGEKLWNPYGKRKTILQVGFGFRYKGWETAIEVVAELRSRGHDPFFTGIFARPAMANPEMDSYLAELMELISTLGVEDNVALIPGFQSEETISRLARTNMVAMFPYVDNGEHTVYGCSGAARMLMSYGIPVVTSNVPLFSDLEGVCPQGHDVNELANHVEAMFNSRYLSELQVTKQEKFVTCNSWPETAKRYAAVLA